MDDLITWLRAQLDDDARVANESWTAQPEKLDMRRVTVDYSIEFVVACTLAWRGEHIARHDPARVLREVEAKRKIIEEHGSREVASLDRDNWGQPFVVCRRCTEGAVRQVVAPCPTLKLLALPFSDRPGYREAWRP